MMEEMEIANQDHQGVEEFINVKEHKAKLKQTAVIAFIAAVILMVGFGFGLNAVIFADANQTSAGVLAEKAKLETSTSSMMSQLTSQNTISNIVEQMGPAVVTIETESQPTGIWGRNELYGRLFDPGNSGQQPVQGLGSGFIISSEGYLLTNNHVIEGADSIKVRLLGSEEAYKATIIGIDKELDLAVLKIEAKKKLPVIPLGNSDNIKTGDWVIAIGNPYGLDHTVTTGVISAKGRPLTIEDTYFESLLQTDASINPGNSGGPLLNLNGEVIGINTAINAAGQGLGFAIPINVVQDVLEDLISKGKVSRPWMGVSLLDITQEIADYLKIDETEGVVIADIVSDSPAQQAGLRQGDIILTMNDKKISESDEVLEMVNNSKIGDKIEVEVMRNKEVRTIMVTLAEK